MACPRHRAGIAIALVISCCWLGLTPTTATAEMDHPRQQSMWTHCYQGWTADWAAALKPYADGNGYGDMTWGAWTQVTDRGYYKDGQTAAYPDRSCDWGSDFLGMAFVVKQEGRRVDSNGYGQRGETDTYVGTYMPYPTEGTAWTIDANHDWAATEPCGITWRTATHAEAEMPHYTPHPPEEVDGVTPGAVVQLYSTGIQLTAPLIANAQNVSVPVGVAAGVPDPAGLKEAARYWLSTNVMVHDLPIPPRP